MDNSGGTQTSSPSTDGVARQHSLTRQKSAVGLLFKPKSRRSSGSATDVSRQASPSLQTSSTASSDDCPVCLSAMQFPFRTSCKHTFCYLCLKNVLRMGANRVPSCPLCRAHLDPAQLRNAEVEGDLYLKDLRNSGSSYVWQYSGNRGYWLYDETTSNIIEEGYRGYLESLAPKIKANHGHGPGSSVSAATGAAGAAADDDGDDTAPKPLARTDTVQQATFIVLQSITSSSTTAQQADDNDVEDDAIVGPLSDCSGGDGAEEGEWKSVSMVGGHKRKAAEPPCTASAPGGPGDCDAPAKEERKDEAGESGENAGNKVSRTGSSSDAGVAASKVRSSTNNDVEGEDGNEDEDEEMEDEDEDHYFDEDEDEDEDHYFVEDEDEDEDEESKDGAATPYLIEIAVGSASYYVDFRRMVQYPAQYPNRTRGVRRILKTDLEDSASGNALVGSGGPGGAPVPSSPTKAKGVAGIRFKNN